MRFHDGPVELTAKVPQYLDRRWGRRGAASQRSLTVNHGYQRIVGTAALQPHQP
jgi:hypothetical protein